uniref:Uncharacterized protein n=1 Tax=Panagrolaimus sp. ES5 TaxID=591445 RepID=A0AC34FCZ2_9BILA
MIPKSIVKRNADAAAAMVEVKSLQSNESMQFLMDIEAGNGNERGREETLSSLNETFSKIKIVESDMLMDASLHHLIDISSHDEKIDDSPASYMIPDDTQLLIDATTDQQGPSSPEFINDSRTVMFTTYCVSIPFIDVNFFDSLFGKNVPATDGTYPVYAKKLSKRYIPILSLFVFIVYCITRMLCLVARPYSNSAARHRPACPCSSYGHCIFSFATLGLGLFALLHAHHYWNYIYDWPHVYAMVDFPVFWLFAEALFLLLVLSVFIEVGLQKFLYAVIKLDRSNFGYRLPPYQADSTLMSTNNVSTAPLQPRNYFDDAQYEPNEMEMTITEIANLHRCYGSRRSGGVAPAPTLNSTFNQQQKPPSVDTPNESSSSNNTYSNCACSTFKNSPADAV